MRNWSCCFPSCRDQTSAACCCRLHTKSLIWRTGLRKPEHAGTYFRLCPPLERCCFLLSYAKKLIWSRLGCGLCRSTPFVILILIRTLEVYKQTYQGEERQSLFFTFQKCPVSHLRFFRGLLFLKYPAAQGSMCTTPSPLQGRGKHRDRTCIWSIWMQHWLKSTREVYSKNSRSHNTIFFLKIEYFFLK